MRRTARVHRLCQERFFFGKFFQMSLFVRTIRLQINDAVSDHFFLRGRRTSCFHFTLRRCCHRLSKNMAAPVESAKQWSTLNHSKPMAPLMRTTDPPLTSSDMAIPLTPQTRQLSSEHDVPSPVIWFDMTEFHNNQYSKSPCRHFFVFGKAKEFPTCLGTHDTHCAYCNKSLTHEVCDISFDWGKKEGDADARGDKTWTKPPEDFYHWHCWSYDEKRSRQSRDFHFYTCTHAVTNKAKSTPNVIYRENCNTPLRVPKSHCTREIPATVTSETSAQLRAVLDAIDSVRLPLLRDA